MPTAPRVSIVIPCFDHGAYLDEAVGSVLAQTYRDFEIVVADDGSTDESTRRLLDGYSRPKTTVLRLTHAGVAAARNAAIQRSRGDFILPLDADDRIAPTYLERAVAALEGGEAVGIVDSEAEFFGEKQGRWQRPSFAMPAFLLGNTIAPCSLFRATDYRLTRGYNANMVSGWEDFDFWLSILELGRKVVRIPEALFSYRVRSGSRSVAMTRRNWSECYFRILLNHPGLYLAHPTILPRYLARWLRP